MKTIKVDFDNVGLYLKSLGLKIDIDYSISINIKTVELNNNRYYCVSILEEKGNFEVFKYAVGADFDDEGVALTDGELHSYKTFKSLKCAIKFALNIKKTGIFPEPEIIY